MLTDWVHWLSQLHWDELLLLFPGLLLLDSPRFVVSKLVICFLDIFGDGIRWLRGKKQPTRYHYCPTVCAILAGYNEAETVGQTIESLVGTYPKLEIIVVDDGSGDGMADAARPYAAKYPEVKVLSRPQRGGKSSAQNFALPYTRAEIIVNVDCDSELGPQAIWEVAQPFADPKVGAVSATILARNAFTNLCTWMQAYEYLHSIFAGRILSERLGILSIASGGFAATRRSAVDRVGGWDVGPPEDLDLTMRVRKCGYNVPFALYSVCYTDVPQTWKSLYRQRIRWDQAAVIRNHMRKHVDMSFFWTRNFRWSNFFVLADAWFFNVICGYGFLAYGLWYVICPPAHLWQLLVALYLCSVVFELLQCVSVFIYSHHVRRDMMVCSVAPLVPFYQLFLMIVRIIANTRELFFRTSYHDNYVPRHVRESTWKW